MTFEEFENASNKELRREVVDRFNRYNERAPSGIEHLLEARSYMGEIDRRHDSWIARRDLILELVVILLIGGEIWLGVKQGTDEGILMEKQTGVLQKLQDSAAATASTLTALQGVTEATNKAIQKEYDLDYRVSLDIVPQGNRQVLTVLNRGHRTILLLGRKVAGLKPNFRKADSAIIFADRTVDLNLPELYNELSKRAPTVGASGSVPLEFYLQSDDGSEWVADYRLNGERGQNQTWEKEISQLLSCTKRPWPSR